MNIYNNSYLLTNEINHNLEKNISKFKNISIIYYNLQEIDRTKYLANCESLYKFCKKKRLAFFITDNLNLCIKYKCDGLFLDNLRSGRNYTYLKKHLHIIGKAHNQIEYSLLIKRGCKTVTLSPLFYNEKYSKNKILGTTRFNLITKNWRSTIYALGGINKKNIKKTNLLQKNGGIVFKNLIENIWNKKNPLTLLQVSGFCRISF